MTVVSDGPWECWNTDTLILTQHSSLNCLRFFILFIYFSWGMGSSRLPVCFLYTCNGWAEPGARNLVSCPTCVPGTRLLPLLTSASCSVQEAGIRYQIPHLNPGSPVWGTGILTSRLYLPWFLGSLWKKVSRVHIDHDSLQETREHLLQHMVGPHWGHRGTLSKASPVLQHVYCKL